MICIHHESFDKGKSSKYQYYPNPIFYVRDGIILYTYMYMICQKIPENNIYIYYFLALVVKRVQCIHNIHVAQYGFKV